MGDGKCVIMAVVKESLFAKAETNSIICNLL